jgi:hypothetical protein
MRRCAASAENPPASAGDTAAPKGTDAADVTSLAIGVTLGLCNWRAVGTSPALATSPALGTAPNAFPLGVKKTTWPTLSLYTFQPSSWTRR